MSLFQRLRHLQVKINYPKVIGLGGFMPVTSCHWDSRGEPKVTGNRQPIWWSSLQGPCPITEPEALASHFDKMGIKSRSESSIFYVLTKHRDSFNGIGTSHANEILHLSMQHPGQMAHIVPPDPQRRQRLQQICPLQESREQRASEIRRHSYLK